MSTFKKMKKYLAKQNDTTLAYDSPFSDYIDGLYAEAVEKLSEQYEGLYIEPSIQCGMGGVFASFRYEDVHYSTNWDFECECETIECLADEADTEEELINSIYEYLNDKLADATPEEDEDEEEA